MGKQCNVRRLGAALKLGLRAVFIKGKGLAHFIRCLARLVINICKQLRALLLFLLLENCWMIMKSLRGLKRFKTCLRFQVLENHCNSMTYQLLLFHQFLRTWLCQTNHQLWTRNSILKWGRSQLPLCHNKINNNSSHRHCHRLRRRLCRCHLQSSHKISSTIA